MFPTKNNFKVFNYSQCLTLTCYIENNAFFRKYYLVNYTNGVTHLYLTTNELDSNYSERYLDDDFTFIDSIDTFFSEFETSLSLEFISPHFAIKLPKYLFFEIHTINNYWKKIFKKHLYESISGFSNIDFTIYEKQQLNYWKQKLNE